MVKFLSKQARDIMDLMFVGRDSRCKVPYRQQFCINEPLYLRPDFLKILTQSYDNLRIFVQYTLILRQIYGNHANTLNIVNITKLM